MKSNTGSFNKGKSGNPNGRPPGSRNNATVACEQLLEGQSEELMQKALAMALDGNVHAMRLCMERLLPVRKDRCIQLDLRPLTTPQDLPIQYQDITLAIGEGRITPSEGESLANILAGHAKIMEIVDLERRVAELEGSQDAVRSNRRQQDQYVDNEGALQVKGVLDERRSADRGVKPSVGDVGVPSEKKGSHQ